MDFNFYPEEVHELESIGVTLEFIEWLYERGLYVIDKACGSSGTWSEVLLFNANAENLKQYQAQHNNRVAADEKPPA